MRNVRRHRTSGAKPVGATNRVGRALLAALAVVVTGCGTEERPARPFPSQIAQAEQRPEDGAEGSIAELLPNARIRLLEPEHGLRGLVLRPADQRPEGLVVFLHGTRGDVYVGLRAGWAEAVLSRGLAFATFMSSGMASLIDRGEVLFDPMAARSPMAGIGRAGVSSWQGRDVVPLLGAVQRLVLEMNVSSDRVLLIGYSNGGAMVGLLAGLAPQLAEHLLLLSSVVAFEHASMASVPDPLAGRSVYLLHGRGDYLAPFAMFEANLEATRRLGAERVFSGVDPKRGHSLWPEQAESVLSYVFGN